MNYLGLPNYTDNAISLIIPEIASNYHVSEHQATEYLTQSFFPDLLNSCPEYVNYRDPSYWATEIMKQVAPDIVVRTNVQLVYNCDTVYLTPPKDFIKWNMQLPDRSEYKNIEIPIDACVAEEIQDLWNKGIHTCGCCCGHGFHLGFIQVEEEDIPKMEQLGYEHYIYEDYFGGIKRKDAFIPKTGHKHIYNKENPYKETNWGRKGVL